MIYLNILIYCNQKGFAPYAKRVYRVKSVYTCRKIVGYGGITDKNILFGTAKQR